MCRVKSDMANIRGSARGVCIVTLTPRASGGDGGDANLLSVSAGTPPVENACDQKSGRERCIALV